MNPSNYFLSYKNHFLKKGVVFLNFRIPKYFSLIWMKIMDKDDENEKRKKKKIPIVLI